MKVYLDRPTVQGWGVKFRPGPKGPGFSEKAPPGLKTTCERLQSPPTDSIFRLLLLLAPRQACPT